jgi:hypothetical protein
MSNPNLHSLQRKKALRTFWNLLIKCLKYNFMAIDLQKLEQKFNALLNDPNFVSDFEQWLEARNISQNAAKPMLAAVHYPSCMQCVFCERNVKWNGVVYHEKYQCTVSKHKVSLSCPNTYCCNRFIPLHSS